MAPFSQHIVFRFILSFDYIFMSTVYGLVTATTTILQGYFSAAPDGTV